MSDLAFQINLCPGDLAYAELTVPRLVRAHPEAAERLLVVDCCRPQATRIVNPGQRFPAPVFAERVATIKALAERWRQAGLFDRVEYLEPGSTRFAPLARRYVRPWMTETHDYGGCAFMAYWAALDLPRHRFVLHYDADMVLCQRPDCDWATQAVARLEADSDIIAAAPRPSPPGWAASPDDDAPSRHEGRPFVRIAGGWLNDWFSTRCFLFDRERLAGCLPLIGVAAGLYWRCRRLVRRGYPPAPEIVLFRRLARRRLRRLNLADENAWLLHPGEKPADFPAILPRLLESIDAGRLPPGQRGRTEIDFALWRSFLPGRN